MVAIQSVQSRIDGLERNISDRIKDMQEFQKVARTAFLIELKQLQKDLQENINEANQKQQNLTYITWAIVFFPLYQWS
ncbi:MAG: hypothetical protein ACON5K_10210 [Bacteroidia bacterium]